MATEVTKREPSARVHFHVPPDMYRRFRAVAEADHRTVSQELRRLMEQRITEVESKGMAA